jgi:hypothetical protein
MQDSIASGEKGYGQDELETTGLHVVKFVKVVTGGEIAGYGGYGVTER